MRSINIRCSEIQDKSIRPRIFETKSIKVSANATQGISLTRERTNKPSADTIKHRDGRILSSLSRWSNTTAQGIENMLSHGARHTIGSRRTCYSILSTKLAVAQRSNRLLSKTTTKGILELKIKTRGIFAASNTALNPSRYANQAQTNMT